KTLRVAPRRPRRASRDPCARRSGRRSRERASPRGRRRDRSCCPGRRPPRRASADLLYAVLLDDRIREELLAHVLHALLRLGGVLRVEIQLDHLAPAHVPHLVETERAERPPDGEPLRGEDRLLQTDHDARLHAAPPAARTLMPRGRGCCRLPTRSGRL